MLSSPRIAALFVYPVKSCAGISVSAVDAMPTGLAHDREWMVVDGAGRFVTQREHPRMALLGTALDPDGLRLAAAGSTLALPFDHEGPLREVMVWRSKVPAFDAGDEAARFISDFLGQSLRLVRFDARHARLSNRDWTGGLKAPNLFSDGYPVLVASEASLADLNARIGGATPLPMSRFRPNLVLGGVGPWAEDRIADFNAGEAELRIVKPCTRCVITTTDQVSGQRDGVEPLRTLGTFRTDRRVGGVTFGQNAIVRRPGRVSVGDAVSG
ncbi:MAG: hypothetical protein RLZZ200_178 [Pseudomonadota bacterium]|jgi:uncharacterized protein YcbX